MKYNCDDFEIIDVWAVHQGDTDMTVGYPAWYFTEEYKAKEVAFKRGWYCGNAPISKHKAIIVHDVYDFPLANTFIYLLSSDSQLKLDEGPDDILAKKAKALAKLTKEDRELLGL